MLTILTACRVRAYTIPYLVPWHGIYIHNPFETGHTNEEHWDMPINTFDRYTWNRRGIHVPLILSTPPALYLYLFDIHKIPLLGAIARITLKELEYDIFDFTKLRNRYTILQWSIWIFDINRQQFKKCDQTINIYEIASNWPRTGLRLYSRHLGGYDHEVFITSCNDKEYMYMEMILQQRN